MNGRRAKELRKQTRRELREKIAAMPAPVLPEREGRGRAFCQGVDALCQKHGIRIDVRAAFAYVPTVPGLTGVDGHPLQLQAFKRDLDELETLFVCRQVCRGQVGVEILPREAAQHD